MRWRIQSWGTPEPISGIVYGYYNRQETYRYMRKAPTQPLAKQIGGTWPIRALGSSCTIKLALLGLRCTAAKVLSEGSSYIRFQPFCGLLGGRRQAVDGDWKLSESHRGTDRAGCSVARGLRPSVRLAKRGCPRQEV